MAILPKYQLKQLFESGDLITQSTLDAFIEASYNPTLVAGSNVTLSKVSTPSGDTITISSTGGGGGSPIIAGDGISITTVGSDKEVSINLDTSQTNLIINGTGKLSFDGIHIQDEGVAVGTYRTINFIGDDVLAEDSGTPGKVNVYIPTPTFASHFNTTDGTTTGTVSESGITRECVRISTPTTEGSPFATNGWAGTNQDGFTDGGTGTVTFSTAQQVTGFSGSVSGDAKILVTVYDADGTTSLETFDTSTVNALYQNQTFTSPSTNITVQILNYAADTSKWKAKVSVVVKAGSILTSNGRSGGRFHVGIDMTTDTTTDGGTTYGYDQEDVFFDPNPSPLPTVNSMTLVESTNPTKVITKHLSGVEYYYRLSEFELNALDIDNLNKNTQGYVNATVAPCTYNMRILAPDYGLPAYNIPAWNPQVGTFNGTWTNQWDLLNADFEYDSWDITNNNYRFRNNDGIGETRVFDPWDGTIGTSSSTPASILIDTWNITSTNLGEDFDDESERLTRGASSYTAFDSTATLGTAISNQTGSAGTFDDGCVVGSNLVRADKFYADNGNSPAVGTVIADLTGYKPDKNGSNPDYSSYSGIPTYHRKFYTSSALPIANFDMTAGGTWGSSGNLVTALANSQIKMYVRRVGSATSVANTFGHGAYPLALHGGLYNSGAPSNPFDDGASGVDTVGSLIRSAGSGNTITGTFGSNSATGGFWLEIQIIDSNIRLDFINVTLEFTNGSTESNPV